ncbi:MAG: type 4a pilus biogenesis protein PilO [Candidatus Methylomirabilota bacterium]
MALDLKGYFANIPKRQRYMLIGLLGGGLVLVYVMLLMKPLWEEKGRLEGELQRLQADLDQKRIIAANRPKLEAEIQALEKQLEVVLVKLPEEKEIPKLLTQVNTLGLQSGLEFLLFRPAAPVKKGFYAEVPIDIRVQGEYHTLGAFLDRVSRLERIVNVADLRISPMAAQQQRTGRTITADFKATTFTFLEKGGSPGAPAK